MTRDLIVFPEFDSVFDMWLNTYFMNGEETLQFTVVNIVGRFGFKPRWIYRNLI